MIADRLSNVLSQLVQVLSSRGWLSQEYGQYLWLWADDRESWLVFRELVIAEGGCCPSAPNFYLNFEDVNWVVDRFQERKYEKILLLDFECQAEFELYLGLIFDSKGTLAKIQRAFDLNRLSREKDYFFASINEKVSGFQIDHSHAGYAQLTQVLSEKGYDIEQCEWNFPDFYEKLRCTRSWMQLLFAVYLTQAHVFAAIYQDDGMVIPVTQVE